MNNSEAEKKAFFKNSSNLFILTLISRVLGLIREITKAALMGTALIADAFSIAYIIPNLFRRLFAEGSMTVAFIPTFKEYLNQNDSQKTKDFLSSFFTILMILVCSTVILGIVSAPFIVKFYGSDLFETTILTQIMFPFLLLVSIAAFLQGILNGVDVFTPSGMAPIFFNLCFILIPILILPWAGNAARAMAIGVVFGGMAQALCQLPAVLKRGFTFGFIDPRIAIKNPGMKKVISLIAPTIVGMAAYQLNQLSCSSIASFSGKGYASSLDYSLRLQEFMLGIFAVSIGTVLLSELSGAAKREDSTGFDDKLRRAMDLIALITIPVSVFSALAAHDIVSVVFKVKEFNNNSVELTAQAFFYHILGLYFIAVNRIVAPAFYAKSDTKSPTFAGVISFGINIPLAFILSIFMKNAGIALALSISSGINMVLLFGFLKKIEKLDFKKVVFNGLQYAFKIILFSLFAGIPTWFSFSWTRSVFYTNTNRFVSSGIPLLISSLVFAFVGVSCLVISKDHIGLELIRMIKRKR